MAWHGPCSVAPRRFPTMSLAKCRRSRKPAEVDSIPESSRRPANARPSTPEGARLLAEDRPVVLQIAGRFQRRLPRNVLRDDLVAAGMGGLWDAIVKHGSDRGESFDWYVRVRVRGAILDE